MTPALGEVVVNTTDKTLHVGDGTTAGGIPLAQLNSPALTGNPTAATQSAGNNTTRVATTAFVTAAIAAIPPAGGGAMPAAVTGTLTTGSSQAFAVDFTTYSAYDVLIDGLTGSAGATTLSVNVSSNAGTSFATETRSNVQYSGTVSGNTGYDLPLNNGSTHGLVGTLVQGSATGTALLTYAGGYAPVKVQTGLTQYATGAAINLVRLSLTGGTFSAGKLILQPKSAR